METPHPGPLPEDGEREEEAAEAQAMIVLTRLNGKGFVLNAELIRTIEENPDTTITLVTGDHIVVKEKMAEVVTRSVDYGRLLRRLMPPT